MPMLPVPAFVALVLAWLALRTRLSGGRMLLVLLLATCAVQSLLVALVGGYGVEMLRPILPVTASLVPPLSWITCRDALMQRQALGTAWRHAAAPLAVLACRAVLPEAVDLLLPAVFLGYGIALVRLMRGRAVAPLARLEADGLPGRIWTALGWALIASAGGEILISAAYLGGYAGWAGWLIALVSSLALLVIGLLSVAPDAAGGEELAAAPGRGGDAVPEGARDGTRDVVSEPDPAPAPQLPDTPASDPGQAAEDAGIVARLAAFLDREQAHLDPGLTLQRLARRLHLPEKRLSAAINRATGQNVSRYVNDWRIRHACALITAGSPVTEAMLASGFNTKSNFNREFRRVTGTAPGRWAAEAPILRPTPRPAPEQAPGRAQGARR